MHRTIALAIAVALSAMPPVLATAAEPELPPICLENAGASHAGMGHGAQGTESTMPSMPSPAHDDLMAGMNRMNADMMAGGTAADIDVAFVCSMIPHHWGAIDMARAQLEHGDEAFPRELAEAVIAAQELEIAQMLDWLESR